MVEEADGTAREGRVSPGLIQPCWGSFFLDQYLIVGFPAEILNFYIALFDQGNPDAVEFSRIRSAFPRPGKQPLSLHCVGMVRKILRICVPPMA